MKDPLQDRTVGMLGARLPGRWGGSRDLSILAGCISRVWCWCCERARWFGMVWFKVLILVGDLSLWRMRVVCCALEVLLLFRSL